jgi:hypothetical protein
MALDVIARPEWPAAEKQHARRSSAWHVDSVEIADRDQK